MQSQQTIGLDPPGRINSDEILRVTGLRLATGPRWLEAGPECELWQGSNFQCQEEKHGQAQDCPNHVRAHQYEEAHDKDRLQVSKEISIESLIQKALPVKSLPIRVLPETDVGCRA